MSIAVDRAFVGKLLDDYAVDACRMGVAEDDPDDDGVPPGMQIGPVNDEGWVEWQILPSTLDAADVSALERAFGVEFPPLFQAYLLARFHLFDQVKSRRFNQQILMTDTPQGRPLKPIRELLSDWQPIIDAGFLPFAEWGDGWGPMCFDSILRGDDGDCPVVWIDHEALITLGDEGCQQRTAVLPLVQPLYGSCREFLTDVFARS